VTKKILTITILLAAISGLCTACTTQVNTGIKVESKPTTITILHDNDTHAHLDDIARRATAVNQVRTEMGAENVLLLNAGDVFMGTLYFNLMHGSADLDFMNMLKYDAMALGNHEFDGFDKQPAYLADFVNNATLPILCANFDFTREPSLSGKVSKYVIIERAGAKFGILGLTTEDTTVISNPGTNIDIEDHVASARKSVSELTKQGVNKIIALTHVGWDNDIELAQQVEGIDVIIGGHSHTVPVCYPTVIDNKEPTLVVQAGSYGKYLGRLEITFDENGVIQNHTGTLFENAKFDEDPVYAAKLAEFNAPLNQLKNTIIGETISDLNGEREQVRTGETNLGDLVADAYLDKARIAKAALAIVNSGSIRDSIEAGKISFDQLLQAMPFGDDIVVFDLTGDEIMAALENGVSQVENKAGRFPQVSGMRFSWNTEAPPGSRIVGVDIETAGGYEPINPQASYRLVTNSFLYQGGDGYTSFQEGTNTEYLGFVDFDILQEYISKNSPVDARLEGRIIPVSSSGDGK